MRFSDESGKIRESEADFRHPKRAAVDSLYRKWYIELEKKGALSL